MPRTGPSWGSKVYTITYCFPLNDFIWAVDFSDGGRYWLNTTTRVLMPRSI